MRDLEIKFAKLIKPGGKILDAGCGGGHYSEYFAKKGFQVVGIDYAPSMIRVARKRVPAGKFIVMDIMRLRFPAHSFEGIWMSAVFHHVPKRRGLSVLRRCFLILKPRGWIYISVHAGKGEGLETTKKFGKSVVRFFANYRADELRALLRKAGFRKIQTKLLRPSQFPAAATQGAQ